MTTKATKQTKAEQTTTCPKCGLKCQGPRVRPHNCAKRQAHPEQYGAQPSRALATIPVKTIALEIVAPDTALHNQFHRRAMFGAAQAACWLAMAGAELARIKKTLKHGQWEPWVEAHCEFNIRTAQKYIGVFAEVKNKALKGTAKTNSGSFLNLLDKPADSLTDAEQLELLKCVHNLTDGATITDLYLDFGIIKDADGRSKNSGGFRPNALILRAWLEQEYADDPDLPEMLAADVFTALPPEVQKRFKAEGKRYEERLTIEQKAELKEAEDARRWNEAAPQAIHEGQDALHFHRASDEQLSALETALADFLAAVREHRKARDGKRPATTTTKGLAR